MRRRKRIFYKKEKQYWVGGDTVGTQYAIFPFFPLYRTHTPPSQPYLPPRTSARSKDERSLLHTGWLYLASVGVFVHSGCYNKTEVAYKQQTFSSGR